MPRCELLLASYGIRGTLRAGQFSHIPNVILASGEEGMWIFDRYQRWMEQKTDWVGAAVTQRPAVQQLAETTIDEEMDLNEIAELARKIEERAQ